jgi:hypothetical protein
MAFDFRSAKTGCVVRIRAVIRSFFYFFNIILLTGFVAYDVDVFDSRIIGFRLSLVHSVVDVAQIITNGCAFIDRRAFVLDLVHVKIRRKLAL